MKKKKILLVDDSGTALMMEQMILKAEPYQLMVAKDGQEALDVAFSERPDLILLDVVMPVMDGFETCKRLRAHETTCSTPIIMVTTRGDGKHVESGFGSGCSDYVTKPIDGFELVAKVRNYLAG